MNTVEKQLAELKQQEDLRNSIDDIMRSIENYFQTIHNKSASTYYEETSAK